MKRRERYTFPLSTKCRIRHFSDYPEENEMPKFVDNCFVHKQIALLKFGITLGSISRPLAATKQVWRSGESDEGHVVRA